MSIRVDLNGSNISSSVSWRNLLLVQVLTKEVDRLTFTILNTAGKSIPEVDDEIALYDGATKIFGGVVVEKNDKVVGGVLTGYEFQCKDYSQYLDRQLVTKNYTDTAAHEVVIDIIDTFTSGFTTTAVVSSSPKLHSAKFSYEQVTRCLTQIADQIGFDWYVDYNKVIHFFDAESVAAPFSLTDTSDNFDYKSFQQNASILQLRNSVYVRGSEYKKPISSADALDVYIADGTQKVFPMAFQYDDLSVTKNGVLQIIGSDQQDDPSGVDVLYNFKEKFLRFETAPTAGTLIRAYGNAFIPIIAKVRDNTSIATYGEYQAAVIDKSITSVGEAQSRAKAELRKFSSTVHEASFTTKTSGLQVGMSLNVNIVSRGINRTFKINRIQAKATKNNVLEYTVYLIASGQVSLVDMMVELLSKSQKEQQVNANDVLQRLETFIENLSLADTFSAPVTTSPPYLFGSGSANDARFDYSTFA